MFGISVKPSNASFRSAYFSLSSAEKSKPRSSFSQTHRHSIDFTDCSATVDFPRSCNKQALEVGQDSGFEHRYISSVDNIAGLDAVDLVTYAKNGQVKNGNNYTPLRVRIEISVTFLKIGEIDTLKEQFEADVLIKSRWREPSLDNSTLGQSIDWSRQWNPKLFIENTIGEPRETAFQMLSHNSDGEAYVLEKRRIKGAFLENLELKDFPFDVQDLTVTLMSERSTIEVELVEDPNEMHKVNKQSFIDEQEWHLYKCTETEIKEVSSELGDPSLKRCALSVKCRAARRPAYFFWNIFLITFLICSLAFATFSVDRSLPQNRLQLSFTLVLTSVAFKFVVNQSLPKISYLTYLDKYVLAAMILLTSVCMWHGLTTAIIVSEDTGHKVEDGALIFFAGGYLLFNIIFMIRLYTSPGLKRRIMKKKEREYSDKFDMLLKKKTARIQSTTVHVTAI